MQSSITSSKVSTEVAAELISSYKMRVFVLNVKKIKSDAPTSPIKLSAEFWDHLDAVDNCVPLLVWHFHPSSVRPKLTDISDDY